MSLFAIITVGTNVKVQEVMSIIDIRSQSCFITDGNWNDSSNWSMGEVPALGSDVLIMANAVVSAGYTAIANEVSLEGGSITVADGGQLGHR